MNSKPLCVGLSMFVLVSMSGCATGTTPGQEGGDQSVAAQDGEENVDEATEAITYNAYNGTCAESLSIRKSPGGSDSYCTVPGQSVVYVYYPPSGAWADVYVPACNVRGWALKEYISVNCY